MVDHQLYGLLLLSYTILKGVLKLFWSSDMSSNYFYSYLFIHLSLLSSFFIFQVISPKFHSRLGYSNIMLTTRNFF